MGRGSARGVCALALLASCAAGPAWCGAWPEPAGQTQAIFKFEDEQANDAFDANGARAPIPHLSDDSLSVFFEHGLTDRLTLQGKFGLTEGEDEFIHYHGRGPIELGLRYTVIHRPKWVLSVYLGGVYDGVGRNAGYALPHQGNSDFEARVLVGRSGVWRRRNVFLDLEAARLVRQGLADETHIDATAGIEFAHGWQVFVQSYNGRADAGPVAPEWAKVETSIVRTLGPWSLQAGWRQTVWGQEDPVTGGPVVAVWRRF
jgi:hypothetical protein